MAPGLGPYQGAETPGNAPTGPGDHCVAQHPGFCLVEVDGHGGLNRGQTDPGEKLWCDCTQVEDSLWEDARKGSESW